MNYGKGNLSERHDCRPTIGDDSGVPARRVATASSRTSENRHEVPHAARNRPPSAHIARYAHRLGESRQDLRPQNRRPRIVPRQRRRSRFESNRSH